jgi:NOL1/NOP2/fmu family ribosome biogenesis protein
VAISKMTEARKRGNKREQPCESEGIRAGDPVEVFSNSQREWLRGVIVKVKNDHVFVEYGDPDDPFEKKLLIGHEDLRLLEESDVGCDHVSRVAVGSPVEVYSRGKQQWFRGEIAKVAPDGTENHVLVQFGPSDSDTYEFEKVLSTDDEGLRFLPTDGTTLLHQQQASRVSHRKNQNDGARGHQHQKRVFHVSVGAPVEVYSHGRQQWCRGLIEEVEPDGTDNHVLVRFGAPGSTEYDLEKVLSVDDDDLRLLTGQDGGFLEHQRQERGSPVSVGAPVEVYSNRLKQWCPGKIAQLGQGDTKNHVLVRFGSPDSDEYGFKKNTRS